MVTLLDSVFQVEVKLSLRCVVGLIGMCGNFGCGGMEEEKMKTGKLRIYLASVVDLF